MPREDALTACGERGWDSAAPIARQCRPVERLSVPGHHLGVVHVEQIEGRVEKLHEAGDAGDAADVLRGRAARALSFRHQPVELRVSGPGPVNGFGQFPVRVRALDPRHGDFLVCRFACPSLDQCPLALCRVVGLQCRRELFRRWLAFPPRTDCARAVPRPWPRSCLWGLDLAGGGEKSAKLGAGQASVCR